MTRSPVVHLRTVRPASTPETERSSKDPRDEEPAIPSPASAALHIYLGNTIVQAALAGTKGPLEAVVAAAMGMEAFGVTAPVVPGKTSNATMARALDAFFQKAAAQAAAAAPGGDKPTGSAESKDGQPPAAPQAPAEQKKRDDEAKLAELKKAASDKDKDARQDSPSTGDQSGAAPQTDAPQRVEDGQGSDSTVESLEIDRRMKVWEIEVLDRRISGKEAEGVRNQKVVADTQEDLQETQGDLSERQQALQQQALSTAQENKPEGTPAPTPETDPRSQQLQRHADALPFKLGRGRRQQEEISEDQKELLEQKAKREEELAEIDEKIAAARQAAQKGGGKGPAGPPPRINRPETSKRAAPLLRAQKGKYQKDLDKLKKEVEALEKKEDKALKAKLDEARKAFDGVVSEIGEWTDKLGAAERKVASLETQIAEQWKRVNAAKEAAKQEEEEDKPLKALSGVALAEGVFKALEESCASAKEDVKTYKANLEAAKTKKPKFEAAYKELQAKYDLSCKDLVAKRQELEELQKYGESFDADIGELEKGSLAYADILAKYSKYPVTVAPVYLKPGEIEPVPELDQEETVAAEAQRKEEEANKKAGEGDSKGDNKDAPKEDPNKPASDFKSEMDKAAADKKKEEEDKKRAEEAKKTPEEKAKEEANKKVEEEQKLAQKYAEILAGDPRKKDEAIAQLAKESGRAPAQLATLHASSIQATASHAKLKDIKDIKNASPNEVADKLGIPASQVRAYQLELKRKEMEERAQRYFGGNTDEAMRQLWKALEDRGMNTKVTSDAQLPADAMMDQLVYADQSKLPPELQGLAGAAKEAARADYEKMSATDREKYDAEVEQKRKAANQIEKNRTDAVEIARTVGLKDAKAAQAYIAALQKSMGLEKPEDAIQYLKMQPEGGGKKPDEALKEKVARARMAPAEEKARLLQEIGKEYGPRALMGVTLQAESSDPDGIVKGPVANDALQTQLAEIKKLPPEKRYDAMKELAAISGQDLNTLLAASENREKKDAVVGNYTSVATDPALSPDERQKKLEEIARARGLKLEALKALMDRQRERTQKLLDEAARVNPKVAELRRQLDDPNKIKDRAKLRAELAKASGVSQKQIEADDQQREWQQKKARWGEKFKMDPEAAAAFVAEHAKTYGIKPDEVEDHLRYSDDPKLPDSAKKAKEALSSWDTDPRNLSAKDRALKEQLDAAGVSDPKDLKKVPTTPAELEALQKQDPARADELYAEFCAYRDKRDKLLNCLDSTIVNDKEALALLDSFSWPELAALLRENPVDEDGRPIMASFEDGVGGEELETAQKWFARASAYNEAIRLYDPSREGEIAAKKKWAKRIDEAKHLKEDAASALGLPPAEAAAHIQAISVSMGVSPREALDLLTGKPVLGPDGKPLKPMTQAQGPQKTLPPEEMQKKLEQIKALPKDQRLAALAALKGEYALDARSVLAVVYHVPEGTRPQDNPAFKAQLQAIQSMPPGPDKDAAMLRLSEHSGLTARQMVDAIDAIQADDDAVAKMHAIRDLPEAERKRALDKLAESSGKSKEELEALYSRSIEELKARVDPKILARLQDASQNGTASPQSTKESIEEICADTGMSPQQAQMLVEQLRGRAFAQDMEAKLGADSHQKLLTGAMDKGMTPEEYANYLARTPESMLQGDDQALALKSALAEAKYEPRFSPEEREAAKKAGILVDPWDPEYQRLSSQLKAQLTGDQTDDEILKILKQMTPAMRALFAKDWEDMRKERESKGMSVPDALEDVFKDALQFGDEDTGLAMLKEAQSYDPEAELKRQFAIVDTEAGPYPQKRDKLAAELMKGKDDADSDTVKALLGSMTLAERAQFLRDMDALKAQLSQEEMNGAVEAAAMPTDLAAFVDGDEQMAQWLKDATLFKSADPTAQWREKAKNVQEMHRVATQAMTELGLPDLRSARLRLEMVTKEYPSLSPENALNLLAGRPIVDDRRKPSAFEQRFINAAITKTNLAREQRGEPIYRAVPAGYDPNRTDPKKLGAWTTDMKKVDSAHAKFAEYFAYEDPLFGKTDLGPHREQIAQLVRDLNPAELAEIDKKFGGKLAQLIEENVNDYFYAKSEITRKLAEMRNFQDSAFEKPYREMMSELVSVDPSKDADPSTPEGLAQRMAFIKTLPFELQIQEINKLQALRRARGADPSTVMDAILYGPKGRRDLPLGPAMMARVSELQKLSWYEQEASLDALAQLAKQDPKAFREAASKTQRDLQIISEYNQLAELPVAERAEKLEALAAEHKLTVDELHEMHWRLKEAGHFPPPKVTLDAEQRQRLQEVSALPPGPERTEALRKLCADTGIQPRDLIAAIHEELTTQRKNRQQSKAQLKEAEALLAKAEKDDPEAMRAALLKYQDKPEELKKVLDKLTPEQRRRLDAELEDCFDGGFWKSEDKVGLLQMQEILGAADKARPEPMLPAGATAEDSAELQHIMRMDDAHPQKQVLLDALKAKLALPEGEWAKLQEHATWGYEAFQQKADARSATLQAALNETFVDEQKVREILASTPPDLLLEMERRSGGKLSQLAADKLTGAMAGDFQLKLKLGTELEGLPPEQRKERTTEIRVADKAQRLEALFRAAKEGPSGWEAFVGGMSARDLTHEQLLETLRDCSDEELKKLNDHFGGRLLLDLEEARQRSLGAAGFAGVVVGGLVPGLGLYAMSTRPDPADERALLGRLKNATREPGTPPIADEATVNAAFERIKDNFDDLWNDRALIAALQGLNGAEIMALKARFEADPALGGDFIARMRADLDGDELAQFVAIMDNARDEVEGRDHRTDMKATAYDLVVREKIRELQRDPSHRGKSEGELYNLATQDSAALDEAVAEKLKKVQDSANALYKAIDGWGDDTDALLGTLAGLTPEETDMVKLEYRRRFGKDLETQMTEDLSLPGWWDATKESWLGDDAQTEKMDLQIALKMMRPESRIEGLRDYFGRMSFSETAWTEDEDLIFSTLEALSPEERTALVSGPKGEKFLELLKRDLGENDAALVDAYTRIDPQTGLALANPAHVAAVKMKVAMHGSGEWWAFGSLGTSEEEFLAELDKLTPEQIREAERYYDQYLSESGATFRSDIHDDFGLDSEELRVIDAELRGDKVAADIHRLRYAAEGWGTNEKLIEDTLKAASEGRGGRTPDHFERVKAGFNQLYGQTGGAYATHDGRSALEVMLDEEFSGAGLSYASEKAYFQQLAEKGKADPEVELLYAMEGWGTDEERVQKILAEYADKSPAERKLLAQRFQEISPDGQSLEDWLESDFGGTELFNLKLQLRGTPQTPEEFLEVARLRYEFERGAGNGLVNSLMDSLEVLGAHSTGSLAARNLADIANMFDSEGRFIGDREELEERSTWLKMDLENYRTVRDTVADYAATAVQVIGAAVCAVVPGLQGGAALIIANLVIAMAATGAKLAIKGSGADWQEGAMDLATAAVSAFTAGVGDKFAALGKGLGGKFAAMLSQTGKMARFLEEVMGKLAESAVESFLNTLLTSEEAWEKGDWAFAQHMLKGTLGGMAQSLGVLGVSKALGNTALGRKLEAIENGDPVKKASFLEHIALKYTDNVIKAGAKEVLSLQNWESWGDQKGGAQLFKSLFIDTAGEALREVVGSRSSAVRAHKLREAEQAAQDAQQALEAVRHNPHATGADIRKAEEAYQAASAKLAALRSHETASQQIAREDREAAEQALSLHHQALLKAQQVLALLGAKPEDELTEAERMRLAEAREQLPALQAQLPELSQALARAQAEEQELREHEARLREHEEAERQAKAAQAERALQREAEAPVAPPEQRLAREDQVPEDPALDKAMTAHALEVAHELAQGEAEIEGAPPPVPPVEVAAPKPPPPPEPSDDEASFAGLMDDEVGPPIVKAPPADSGETWQLPKGPADDPEIAAYQREVEQRAARLMAADPELSERDAVRQARNEVLHSIGDEEPSAVAQKSAAMAEAASAGDHAAVLAHVQEVADPRERRELDLELRRQGSSLQEVLSSLPSNEQQQARARLDSLVPSAEQVAAATRLLTLVEQARAALQTGDPSEIAAYRRARQQAIEYLVQIYGIDDTALRARDRGARTGLQVEGSAIVAPDLHVGGDALARPEGVVLVGESLLGARMDGSFDPRNPGLIAAALAHEAEVHVRQANEGRMGAPLTPEQRAMGAPDTGTGINEVEAYAFMLRNRERFGLTEQDLLPIERGLDAHLRILRAQTTSDPISLTGPLPPGTDPVIAAALRRLMLAEPRRAGADGDGVHDPRTLGHETSDPTALARVLRGDFSLTTPAEAPARNEPWVGQAPLRSRDEPVLPSIEQDLRGGSGKRVELDAPEAEVASRLSAVQAQLEAELAKPRPDAFTVHKLRSELVELAESYGLMHGQQAEVELASLQAAARSEQAQLDAAVARAQEKLDKAPPPRQALDSAIAALSRLQNHKDPDIAEQAKHSIEVLQAIQAGDLSRADELDPPEYAASAVKHAVAAARARAEAEAELRSAQHRQATDAQAGQAARRAAELEGAPAQKRQALLERDPDGLVARALAEAERSKAAERELYELYRTQGNGKNKLGFYDLRRALAANHTFINESGNEASWATCRPLDRVAQPLTGQQDKLLAPSDPAVAGLLSARQAAQKAMRDAEARLEAAKRAGQDTDALKKEVGQHQRAMNDASEALGQMAADAHAAKMGWKDAGFDADLVTPKGANAFDRIYQDADGKLVIVECKGGDSQLGSRMSADGTLRVQQGSRAYIEAIIEAIRKREHARTPGSSPQADRLQAALEAGRIRSLAVRQPVDSAHQLGSAEIQEFDVQKDFDGHRKVVAPAAPVPVSVGAPSAEAVVGTSARTGERYHATAGGQGDIGRVVAAASAVLVSAVQRPGLLGQGLTVHMDGTLDIVVSEERSARARFEVVPSSQMKDGAVAQYVRAPDGTWVVQISAGAHPEHVHRAIAHECAELRALVRDGRTDIEGDVSLLAADAALPGKDARLTAHDEGRVAELSVLHAELSDTTDPQVLARKKAELDELVEHLGLTGPEGARRLQWLVETLGPDHPGVRVAYSAAGQRPLDNSVRDAQILTAVDTVHNAISRGLDKVDHAKINSPINGAAPMPGQLPTAGLAGLEPHEVVRFLAVYAQRYGTDAQKLGLLVPDMVALLASRGMKSRDLAEARAHLSGDPVQGARAAVLNALGEEGFLRDAERERPRDGQVLETLADVRRPLDSAGTRIKRALVEDNAHIIEILSNLTPEQRKAVLRGEVSLLPETVTLKVRTTTLQALVDDEIVKEGPVRHKWEAVQKDNDLDMQAGLIAAQIQEAMQGTRQKRDVKALVGRIMGSVMGADAILRRDDVLGLMDKLRGNPELYERVCQAYLAQANKDGRRLEEGTTGRELLGGDVSRALRRREWDFLDTVMSWVPGVGILWGVGRTLAHRAMNTDSEQARGHQDQIARARLAHADLDLSPEHRALVQRLAALRPGKRFSSDELLSFVQATRVEREGVVTAESLKMRETLAELGLPADKLEAYAAEVQRLEQVERAHQILAAMKLDKYDALPSLLEDKEFAATRRALLARIDHPATTEAERKEAMLQLEAAAARMEGRKRELEAAMAQARGLSGDEAAHAMADLIGEISRRANMSLEEGDRSFGLRHPLTLDGRNFARWADKAWERGYLEDHEALFFSTHGIGSDPLKAITLLQGKTPEQIEDMTRLYIVNFVPAAEQAEALDNPRAFLDALVDEEFGGRIGLPVRLAAKGDPAAIFDPGKPPADAELKRAQASQRLQVELAQIGLEFEVERGSAVARGIQDIAERAHEKAGTKAATGKQLDALKGEIDAFVAQHGDKLREGDAGAWKAFQALRKQHASLAQAAGAYRDLLAKDVVTWMARAAALGALAIPFPADTLGLLAKTAYGAVTSGVGTGAERVIRGGEAMSQADLLKALAQNALGSASAVAFGLQSKALKEEMAEGLLRSIVADGLLVGVPKAAVSGAIKGGVDPAVLRLARMRDKVGEQVQGALGDQIVTGPVAPLVHEGTDLTPLAGQPHQGLLDAEMVGEVKASIADKTAWEANRAKAGETLDSRLAAEEAGKKSDPDNPTPAARLKAAHEGVFKALAGSGSTAEVSAPAPLDPVPTRREMPPTTVIRPRKFGDPALTEALARLLPRIASGEASAEEMRQARVLGGRLGLWCAAHGPFAEASLKQASSGLSSDQCEAALARMRVPRHPEVGSEAHLRATQTASLEAQVLVMRLALQLEQEQQQGKGPLETVITRHRLADAQWLLAQLQAREAEIGPGAPEERPAQGAPLR